LWRVNNLGISTQDTLHHACHIAQVEGVVRLGGSGQQCSTYTVVYLNRAGHYGVGEARDRIIEVPERAMSSRSGRVSSRGGRVTIWV
jgi:hypothetical protein